MQVYVQVCIDCVEEDANIEQLAEQCVEQLQEAQPYHYISLNDVEVA